MDTSETMEDVGGQNGDLLATVAAASTPSTSRNASDSPSDPTAAEVSTTTDAPTVSAATEAPTASAEAEQDFEEMHEDVISLPGREEEVGGVEEEQVHVPLENQVPPVQEYYEDYFPDDSMHDVPFGRVSPAVFRPAPDDPRLMRAPVPRPPPEELLMEDTDSSDEDYQAAADAAFADFRGIQPLRERSRHWYVSQRTVHQAIRQVIANGRRGDNDIASLLNRATFMQRMRRAIFSMGRNDPPGDNSVEDMIDNDDGDGEGEGEDADDAANRAEAAAAARARDEARENSVRFDTNLPAEHSYLGAMNRVSGVDYLEVGQRYRMMLFMHQHILFPGEVLPFMISGSIIDADIDAQNGLLFGVCFTFLNGGERRDGEGRPNNVPEDDDDDAPVYGVTCQIYERGTDVTGNNTLIKSRALQRFVVKKSEITGPLQFIAAHPQLKCYGYVQILEEIYLPEPLSCINMGSMNRFRDNASMSQMYRRFQAASTPWPAHIYDNYSISAIVEKARTQLAQHKIDTMPTDPTQLSFWLVRNLPLSESMMKTIFMTDSVNTRLKLISSTFKEDDVFTCRYCDNRIANCRELFAMSKHGVQTQYCNSAGFIHETNTVYQLLRHAVSYSGMPSTEYSWFPGYEWHIIVCKICMRHIGWQYMAVEDNLVPRFFFGISSSSVRVSSATTLPANPREVIYRNFMAIARAEML